MEVKENKFPSYKDHLNKTFLEELNYNLWVTKGTRFQAHHRLISKNNKSISSVAFLTAYLIIFGLIGAFQSDLNPFIPPNYVEFGSLAGSILVLIFSQLESAKDYKLNAFLYHYCALELTQLYNSIRIRKTLNKESPENDETFCKNIEARYNEIMSKYPNHEEIDYKKFKLSKSEYYENITKYQKNLWPIIYLFKTSLLYYLFIGLPPIIFLIYWLIYSS